MDYKEKYETLLEKYKMALEGVQEILSTGEDSVKMSILQLRLQGIFPELKESEDEKIRKALIDYFRWNTDSQLLNEFTNREVFAWLEKQGEQKHKDRYTFNSIPLDKVEPKFQNGQWIVWQNQCYKVNYNSCGYKLIDQNGLITSLEYETVDNYAHLWTIEDAKDGDVLYSLDSKQPFIFKHRKFNEQAEVYYGINIYGKFFVGNTKDCIITTDKYIPATKEQRAFLFQKMKEAGYVLKRKN